MKKNLIFIFLISPFFFACNGSEEIEKTIGTGNYYDPQKPVSVTELLPAWGKIDQNFLIRGNFPKNTDQIRVYFDTKRAVILGCDGHELYGMIPKQSPGYNQLSVVIGKDSIVPNIKFKYYQKQSLKNIVGKEGEGDNYVEGSFDEARIKNPTGLGTVKGQKGDNIIMVEGEWDSRISLISLDDNKMLKIGDVGWCGGPAVTNTRDKFYVINRDGNRNIYSFSKADGWIATPVADLQITNDMLSSGWIVGGLTFAEDDRYLYVMTGDGHMGCIDLIEKTFSKILSSSDWDGVNVGSGGSYLVYSKYYHCFFATLEGANGMFKIEKNAEGKWKAKKFAGFNSGNDIVLGHRLNDAVLRNPSGIAVNKDGEIYFGSKSGSCILKIKGDMVSLVAGVPNAWWTGVSNIPLESGFNQPLAIVTDFEDNFYIADRDKRLVRKLTIE